jgi:hypothetical protein
MRFTATYGPSSSAAFDRLAIISNRVEEAATLAPELDIEDVFLCDDAAVSGQRDEQHLIFAAGRGQNERVKYPDGFAVRLGRTENATVPIA